MGIKHNITTQFGEDRECYIRLNNVEANNHGSPTYALFRGYISKEAFNAGAHFVWEKSIEFEPDVSEPLWPQAYAALIDEENMSSKEV